MSQDNDLSDVEFATVIAAAAFAVNLLEETGSQNHRSTSEGMEISLTKSKPRRNSRRVQFLEPDRVSTQVSSKEAKEDTQYPGEASMNISEVLAGQRIQEGTIDERISKMADASTIPTVKKAPTLADVLNNGMGSSKLGTEVDTRPNVNHTLSTTPRNGGSKADDWEKDEMAQINKRYERNSSTILSWENKKKVKAKRRMDRMESELERSRERALRRYYNDISQIDRIVGGAKAITEERRRKEESKAKEKAKKKVSAKCFCF